MWEKRRKAANHVPRYAEDSGVTQGVAVASLTSA
jgi:hypothetical protein